MKKGLLLFFLAICIVGSANTYYVAPTGGSDNNPGTISQPWATWQKAFNTAMAGDTVFFRGGVWYPKEHADGNNITLIHPDDGIGYSGTSDNKICYFNYPGEVPILDCSQVNMSGNTFNTGIDMIGLHFVHFRGLTVRNILQPASGNVATGISSYWGSNHTYENIVVHNVGGRGFEHMGSLGFGSNTYDTTRWINCDSYNNHDPFSEDPGNAADGWKCDNEAGGVFLFDGCRAWNNSDDGFDPSGSSVVVFHNCWSFANGFVGALDGNGFKSGGVRHDVSVPTRILYKCLAAYNIGVAASGFYDLEYPEYYRNNSRVFNNTFYRNNIGIGISDNYLWPESKSQYYNNIAYDSYDEDGAGRPMNVATWSHYTESHNTFDFADETQVGSLPLFVETDTVTVTDSDFVLIDSTTAVSQLMAPRKADHSLPDITFLTLAEGSDLIDAGTANIPDIEILDILGIDYNYNGSAPDLGYSEYLSGTVSPPNPIYVSSVIENASPARLDMTYSLTLANVIPPASAFTVKVNGVTRTVSSVAISGTKVFLTLSSPVVSDDAVTVAYTKPASNPLQTTAGGQAASITARNVTNNVTAPLPIYVSSVIENASPARLDMTYSLTLVNIIPPASAFTVKVNGVTRTVSSVAISGTKVFLTLSSPVVYGDAVTVTYTKPATNPLQTTAGGQAASIAAQNVINHVAAPIPIYVSSVIENASPSRLDITYSLSLANVIPPASAFTVKVNGVTRNVSSVAISGTKVFLTLSSPVKFGDVVTVAYTKPSTNPLQTAAGGLPVTMSDKSVINNCSATGNLPPIISISSPIKNSVFVSPASITIDAIASDPDGNIAKVEFFSGNTKLAEKTTAPFSYTWKDVLEGNYTLTAMATDNLNSKTVSESISVIVEKSSPITNQAPVINLKLPKKNGRYKKNEAIIIEAVATDVDGTISKVQLKSGTILLAELTTPPYIYIWEDADVGTYQIVAIATDNLGATAESLTLELLVEPEEATDLVKLYPNPNNGYLKVDIVSPLPEGQNFMKIISTEGKTIWEKALLTGEDFSEVEITKTAAGSYILLITNDRRILTAKKFIKL